MTTARAGLAVTALVALAVGCASSIQTQAPARSVAYAYDEPRADAITFWGHACAYIDVGGFGIVTDPVFAPRFATIRRRLIPAPPLGAYDQTRVVLISHAHQDHLDPETLARFSAGTVILAPEPATQYIRSHGLRARVMKPGDEYPFPGGTIIAVAAHHPGGRLSLKARHDGRAIGYVIRTADRTIYYTGDTEYFGGFAAIRAAYRPDVTLLNLNAHLHSKEAVTAIRDLGSPAVVPIHFGAYEGKSVRLGPLWRDELIDSLGARILPLEVGQSVALADLPRAAAALRPIDAGDAARIAAYAAEPRGIARFDEIEPGLARGAQPDEDGFRFLRDRGYRTVISFRKNPAERRRLESMGIRYVEIPMHAGLFSATPPSERDVRQFLSIVSDSAQRPVFIHCRHGKDRTGAMAALYRIESCGWTPEEAIDEMRSFGFSRHYRNLIRFVRGYRGRIGAPTDSIGDLGFAVPLPISR